MLWGAQKKLATGLFIYYVLLMDFDPVGAQTPKPNVFVDSGLKMLKLRSEYLLGHSWIMPRQVS